MKDGLLEIIKTGICFGVSVGSSSVAVTKMLGGSDGVLDLNQKANMHNYGNLEIYFLDNKVDRLYLKVNDGNLVCPYLSDEVSTEMNTVSSLDDLIVFLENHGISWVIDRGLTDNETVCIACDSSIGIFYSLTGHGIYSVGTITHDLREYLIE